MAGQQPKQPGTEGYEKACIITGACLVLVFVAILLWHLHRPWIVTPIFTYRYYQAIGIEFILAKWNVVAHWLNLPASAMVNIQVFHDLKAYIQSTPDQQVTYKLFKDVNSFIGNWFRYPVIIILLGSAGFLYFFHADNRFQTIYNMNKLKKSQAQNWPQITPILSIDLLKTDLDEGPWAMAQLPFDFSKQHNLLMIGIDEKEGKKIWKLKSSAAHSVLALQLGPIWPGVQSLPIEIKALVVIFIARAVRERKIADRFLSQISASATSGKLNFVGVEEQLKKYADHKLIKWLEQRHAYVYTVMASLLEIARADGVLASAEFLWLKPVNRRLWYTLNTVGRMTSVVETSGIYAHWLVEKKLGRAVKTPMVKEAVVALEQSVEDILYIEEGDKWHTVHAA